MESFIWKNYKIFRPNIGHGSFSKVYKAMDLKNNREVAIKKVLLTNISENLKTRLFRELEILEKVNHRNIIKYYEYYIEDGYLYIIMECCESDISKLIINIKNFY